MRNMLEPSPIRPTFHLWKPTLICFLNSPAIYPLSCLLLPDPESKSQLPLFHSPIEMPGVTPSFPGSPWKKWSEGFMEIRASFTKAPSPPQQYLALSPTNPSSPCSLSHCSSLIANIVCQPSRTKVPRNGTKTVLNISMEVELWIKLISKLMDFEWNRLPYLSGPLPKDRKD